jgi:hypothetical protein
MSAIIFVILSQSTMSSAQYERAGHTADFARQERQHYGWGELVLLLGAVGPQHDEGTLPNWHLNEWVLYRLSPYLEFSRKKTPIYGLRYW